MMYEFLRKAYLEKKIGVAQLEHAVSKGWITEEEKNRIIEEFAIQESNPM